MLNVTSTLLKFRGKYLLFTVLYSIYLTAAVAGYFADKIFHTKHIIYL